jgi:hypothetical protein
MIPVRNRIHITLLVLDNHKVFAIAEENIRYVLKILMEGISETGS